MVVLSHFDWRAVLVLIPKFRKGWLERMSEPSEMSNILHHLGIRPRKISMSAHDITLWCGLIEPPGLVAQRDRSDWTGVRIWPGMNIMAMIAYYY